jgi:two-component system, LytTR family, response regulator
LFQISIEKLARFLYANRRPHLDFLPDFHYLWKTNLTMIKVLIIDDEPGVRRLMSLMLNQHCPDVHIAGEAGSVASAYEAIVELKPDLIFLDIKMDDGTGFDLLQKFEKVDFHVIFITAFEEYAVKAFRFSAIDYLLKPVEAEELIAAVEKMKRLQDAEQDQRISTLIRNMKEGGKEHKKVVLRTLDRFHFVKISEILYCESDGNYTTFYLENGTMILVSKSLKEYDDILAEYSFFRPHKSYLINLSYVTGFEKAEGGFIIMKNNARIPISFRKKEEFLRIVEGL